MSEERRIQSAPAAPAVPDDEIPLDHEVTTAPPPPPSPPIPKERPSSLLKPAEVTESPSVRRVRARMTLRIPDDEVGRPTPRAQPVAEPFEPMQEIKGHLIISVGAAPTDEGVPTPPVMQAAPPVREREDSWTPYEPVIANVEPAPITPREPRFDAESTGEYLPPISEEIPIVDDLAPVPVVRPTEPSSEHLEIDDAAITPYPPAPATPLAPSLHAQARVIVPPTTPLPADLPPVRPRMRAMRDSVVDDELFDDGFSSPSESEADFLPLPAPERKSEPGDAAEIAPEDLLAVESTPLPRKGPPMPPTRARAKSFPPAPGSNPPSALAAQAQTRSSAPAPAGSTPPSAPPYNPAAAVSPPAPIVAGPPAAMIGTPPTAVNKPRVIVPTPQGPQTAGIAPPAMTAEAAQRKRIRPWWEELFSDEFLRTSAKLTDEHIAAEVNFIEESLGVARDGGVVLDLACGTGLHAIELARRGYHVVGFDLSLAMLARAADEAQERGVTLNFLQGDMRDITFDEAFDGVFSWDTSFGFFEEEKNAQVISRVHKALKPGGVFLLDVVNRDYVMRQSPSLAWFEGEGCVCMDEMQLDFITSRMRVKRTMMLDDGRTREIDYSVRVYSLHELGRILHEQGFKVAEVSGRVATPGVFLGSESPRTLILAEKR